MITLYLELDELLLLADLVHRTKDDFDVHLLDDPALVKAEGYASVVMLQVHNRLELIGRMLSDAAPEPLEYCTASQSLRLQSQCYWRQRATAKGLPND
jgi:hypothetical protein